MTRTSLVLFALALAGCDVDDFVIGESDGCSSSTGAGEAAAEECGEESCAADVNNASLAERQARASEQPAPSRPDPVLAQERR